MATKVKGITIELSADASGIEKALKDVNKELNSTQKQLTSVDKALKLDPTNLELIEQKERLLAKATEEAAKKLEALKEAQEDVANNGGKGSAGYDALTREIAETQARLTGLNNEQQAFGRQAAEARTQASGFGSALTSVGNAANIVAEKTAALSGAAAAALGGMVALTMQAASQADEWLTLSQQIGLSASTLQKLEYASSQVDVDINDITGAITRMVGNLDGAEDTWNKIGVQVKNANGEYKNTEQIFFEVLRGLSQIGNETERDEAAMAIFGKSARELAGIIDDGGQKMKALGDEAESMGLIISDENLERLAEFDDAIEKMKAQMKSAFTALAVPALEAFAPLVEQIAQAVASLAQELANTNPTLMKIIGIVLLVVMAISPIASLIANVAFSIVGLSIVLPIVTAQVSAFNASLASLAANPVTWIIAGIVVVLGLLIAAIAVTVKHWDEIKGAASSAMQTVQSAVSSGVSAVRQFVDLFVEGLTGIPSITSKIGDAFQNVVGKITSVVERIRTAFHNLVSNATEAGKNVLKGFVQGFQSVISSVTAAVQRLAQSIRSVWQALQMDAGNAGRQTASNYAWGYNSGVGYLRSFTIPAATKSYSSSMSTDALTYAVNQLTSAMSRQQPSSTNVNVELVGSAKNIFDTVRVQNTKLKTATGYHALA